MIKIHLSKNKNQLVQWLKVQVNQWNCTTVQKEKIGIINKQRKTSKTY